MRYRRSYGCWQHSGAECVTSRCQFTAVGFRAGGEIVPCGFIVLSCFIYYLPIYLFLFFSHVFILAIFVYLFAVLYSNVPCSVFQPRFFA